MKYLCYLQPWWILNCHLIAEKMHYIFNHFYEKRPERTYINCFGHNVFLWNFFILYSHVKNKYLTLVTDKHVYMNGFLTFVQIFTSKQNINHWNQCCTITKLNPISCRTKQAINQISIWLWLGFSCQSPGSCWLES